jgi:hypothetical protein
MWMRTERVAARVAAAALVASTVGADATAATIDFTDQDSYSAGPGSASGTVQGIGWTLTPSSGPLSYTSFDGGTETDGPLAFEYDGIGIGDDEISYNTSTKTSEFLTLTFASPVYLMGLHFLDLYGFESVQVKSGDALLMSIAATVAARDLAKGGYRYEAVSP